MLRIFYSFILAFLFFGNFAFTQCVGTAGEVTWMYWEDVRHYWNFEHEFTFMHEDDTYPNGPDYTRKINSLSTPRNYENYYAAVTKGFISVPDSGPTTFNVTGDDYTIFLLSTDATAANLDTVALAPGYTGFEEYNDTTAQTSSAIQLNTGQYYYFEIHHREYGGGDYAVVRWQRPYVSDSTWQIISSPFLTSVCDSDICPPKGTPCDDSNASTFDDLEDGNCNCIGTPDTTGLHVGERGVLDVYFYDNTGNGNIAELSAPNFPSIPNSMAKQRNGLYMQWDWGGSYEDYALFVQGYFVVPVTGVYDFNVTGARNVEFRMNTNGSAPTTNQTISIRWGSGMAEHDEDPSQTVTGVSLTAGTFYYFELVQAMTTWGHYANVFWKVPGHDDSEWHMIPYVNFFDYTNESACIADGESCDDGDPFTYNDRITNCDCAGDPCTVGVNCDDPAANNFTYDYCETSQQLGNRADDAWLSCSVANAPPLAARNGNHWIQYDLGREYFIKDSRIWNYNVPGNLDQGFQNVVIDYSTDGITWTQLGTYNWQLANGNNTYTGFPGPDFGSAAARYILITSLDGGSCRGLHKVTFRVGECEDKGDVCDDGDMATVNDHFDGNCNCVGYPIADLDCGRDTLFVNQSDLPTSSYHAMMALMSEGTVMNSSDVNFKAGIEIVLDAGFEVESGGLLSVDIEDCAESAIVILPEKSLGKNLSEKVKPEESLEIYSLPNSSIQTIRMYFPDATDAKLEVLDINHSLVMPLSQHHYPNHGDFYKRLQTKKLPSGVYLIKLTTDNGEYIERMVVSNVNEF